MMPSRTNLAAGIPSSKVKYSRLSSTDDGYIDLQFKKSPPKIPYKAIALATVLFLIGTFLIIIGSLLLSGYISKGDFTICASPTMHPKATGVTPMMTFQTLMTSSHLSLEKRHSAPTLRHQAGTMAKSEEIYSLQMFSKTMAGLYECFSKMLMLYN
ncbi:transmembrane protein 230 isoform X1 [Cricetulus griseus]|uniref:Transmembrane protein 230 isoform X1 n=1 Tax=Cricetulus griseus TaxID=10029 RepID=A0A9J7JS07_CRIGR|nr:transmembrane protein 230 isoform X1 [Cricetulus griseus]XP_027277521.1 transmembrane protein 230 isoform X1 [Cricetulus griseus]XP_027277522.1 transmembrane protein 230 isoform X1 [Cricetulus griseus]XP_027282041.1 transmembrane protein 230 isoform X1 [Cricetulus griseus]